ncbi:MAG: DEAD/DEAH box helicase [Evtepia sp.]
MGEARRPAPRTAAKDLAEGLIAALRPAAAAGPAMPSPRTPPGSRSSRTPFPIPETDDQLRCIAEIKQDMEQARPMDRLLCGDVGYGKTEVAFRAVMKCVLDGKQAAILVPTTVLAQQHYADRRAPLSGLPGEDRGALAASAPPSSRSEISAADLRSGA